MFHRIRKEVKNFQSDTSISVVFSELANRVFIIRFEGPKGSLYEDIVMTMNLVYPMEYPFKPPNIIFDPCIFHPNIAEDGNLKVGSLVGKDWSPALTTTHIFLTILSLFFEPFVCEENVVKINNDKGKEEEDAIYECANMSALDLWRKSPDQYRQVLVSLYL